MKRRYWTNHEVEFVRANWNAMTAAEIGAHIGRTEEAVASKIRKRLRLKKDRPAKEYTPSREWRTTEVAFLRQHYHRMNASQIAWRIGRTPDAVYRFARANGIQKYPRKSRRLATIEATEGRAA